MLIAVLLFSETTIEKLAGHQISAEEVRQVSDGDRIVIGNPRPRVDGSLLMIGPTRGRPTFCVSAVVDDISDCGWWLM